jgi:4-amino-4-deoxy-L-arabinose transferase-like glycosyltransferase
MLGIVVVGWMLFGWHLAQRGMWSSHEGRAAQNAQTILDDGNWLVPHLYTGEPELQKPPLYYWAVAVCTWLDDGRVDAMCVRLPAALSAIGCLLVVFWLGRSMWDWETGVWSAALLAMVTRFAWLARVGRIDMPLCLVVVSSLALVWQATRTWQRDVTEGRPRVSWWLYGLLAAGLLLKGPVVLIHVGLPTAIYLMLLGVPILPKFQAGWWQTWKDLRVLPGLALFAAIAAPWFVLASIATKGEFFWSFFVYHNIERAAGTSEALKAGPVWFYVPRLFVDAFPWSLLLPVLWVSLWQQRSRWWPTLAKNRGGDAEGRAILFLVVWGVSQFVFLSLVSFKRADYLLPCLPAVALLLAGWLRDRGLRWRSEAIWARVRQVRRRRWVLATASFLAAATAPLVIWGGMAFHENGLLDALLEVDLLRSHLNETDRFMIRHVEGIMRANGPILFIGGIVVIASVWMTHTGWYQCQNRRLLLGLGAPWLVAFLFQIHVLLPALDPLREMSRFARTVRAVAGPREPIYYFGKVDSDLAFHMGRPAKSLESWEELALLTGRPEACYVVLKAEQLEWVRRDPRLAGWLPIVDNRTLAFGGHRDHRLLLVSKPEMLADRLIGAGWLR